MKRRLYRKILKTLRKFFGKSLKGHKRSRLYKLAAFISGLMRTKRPDMRSIGSGLLQQIKCHSKEKEVKKFLENRWIDGQTYYEPYIAQIVEKIIALFPKRTDVILVIDGSKMGKNHMALLTSLFFQGRGLPLTWLVQKKPKGHFKSTKHVELLHKTYQLLSPILPKSK